MSFDQKRERCQDFEYSPSQHRPLKRPRNSLYDYVPTAFPSVFASFPGKLASAASSLLSWRPWSQTESPGSGERDKKYSKASPSPASLKTPRGPSSRRSRRRSLEARRHTPTFHRLKREAIDTQERLLAAQPRARRESRPLRPSRAIPERIRDAPLHFHDVMVDSADQDIDVLSEKLKHLQLAGHAQRQARQKDTKSEISAYREELAKREAEAKAHTLDGKLVPLNDDEAETVDRILFYENDANKLLGEVANIEITVDLIRCLRPRTWLNDEAINYYMAMLEDRSKRMVADPNVPKQKKVKAIFFNTFFMPKLAGRGQQKYAYRSVKRWTKKKKVDIFTLDRVIMPVHVGEAHWCLASFNMKTRVLEYYDSLFFENSWAIECLQKYLKDEHQDKKKKPLTDKWTVKIYGHSEIPNQSNGCDCGVFTCMFADCLGEGRDFNFVQEDMELLRRKMVLAILDGQVDWNAYANPSR